MINIDQIWKGKSRREEDLGAGVDLIEPEALTLTYHSTVLYYLVAHG